MSCYDELTERACPSPRGSECHCAQCHQTFTGLTLFDAHQKVDYSDRWPVFCCAGGNMGLAQDARGTWGTPEGLKSRESHATRLAAARSARAGAVS